MGFEPTGHSRASVGKLYRGKVHTTDTIDTIDVVTYVVTVMASLRRKPNSKYWIACFTLPDGKRAQRSTKVTNKKLAQKIADDYEAATRARQTEGHVRRVLSELHRLTTGITLGSVTVKAYLERWLGAKQGTISESTKSSYSATIKGFNDFLSERAGVELIYLTPTEIAAFRDHVASTRAVATANKWLKILRVAFQQAWRDGLLESNPAAKVPSLKAVQNVNERRAFTLDELKGLLKVAEPEWKGMILFGVYTGQRLGDLVRLRWKNLDVKNQTLSLVTQKTARRQILPLAKPVVGWLSESERPSEDMDAPLFPKLFGSVERTGKVAWVSNAFYDVMVGASIVPSRSHQKDEQAEGRVGRRRQSELSFHSLRHTATSLMQNAGVSPAVVQEFVGHESKAVSQQYTHIELDALRKAAVLLPAL